MDDMTPFEDRFEVRLRTFAMTGVRSVDAVAVASAVAVGHPRRAASGGQTMRWLGLTFDRRAWVLAVALGLLVALLGGALLVGARLLSLPSSPASLRLAHLVYILDNDIYVADWDGANPIRTVDGDTDAACRDWVELDGLVSPDGRHIAYRSNSGEGCQSTIEISDLDGHLVASLPGEGRGVAWSPDSTRIATWLTWRGPMIGIYGMDEVRQAVLDGSSVCCDQDYSRPVWSPDATSLLVRRHRDDPESAPTEWELPINGDPAHPISQADPRAFGPGGPPAVSSLYWTQRQPLAEVVASSSVTGANGAPGLGLNRWQRPVWSAAGDRMAYVYAEPFSEELWVVDPTTGVATMLASGRWPESLQPLGFSPSGDRLLVSQTDEDGSDSLWGVSTDGSGALTLVVGRETLGPGSIELLGSSPDGELLLFGMTDDPDGDPASNRSLWSVNTGGSGARMLVAGTENGAWVSLPADEAGPATP